MRDKLFLRQGQNITEYMLILGIVVAAFIGMQIYIKRGIQAAIKVASDELGSQESEEIDIEKGTKTNSLINTLTDSTRRIRLYDGGTQNTEIDTNTQSTGPSTFISQQER